MPDCHAEGEAWEAFHFAAGMEAFSRRAAQTPNTHAALEAAVVLQLHAEKSLCSQDNVK